MKELKGKISISHVRSSHNADHMRIELQDEKSGISFCLVKFDLLTFANLITGQGYMPCDITLHNLENVGKKCIHEERVIEHHGSHGDKEAEAMTLAKHETNGWFARSGDLNNMHRSVGKDNYRVVFFKYVDDDEDE